MTESIEMVPLIITALYLVICTVTDLIRRQIYLSVSICFFITGVVFSMTGAGVNFRNAAAGILIGAAILAAGALTKEAIGIGDGIVFMVTGIYLGFYENLGLFLISTFLCGIVSAILLVMRICKKKDSIPFAPFAAGALLILILLERC